MFLLYVIMLFFGCFTQIFLYFPPIYHYFNNTFLFTVYILPILLIFSSYITIVFPSVSVLFFGNIVIFFYFSIIPLKNSIYTL